MATSSPSHTFHNSSSSLSSSSSQRGVAMLLALISAVVLSPLYVDRKTDQKHHDAKWGSGFVLPMVLLGLIVAIKTTSTGSSRSCGSSKALFTSSNEHSAVLRIGSSSWGLAAILVMLMLVMSWQSSLQHFLWR